MATKAVAVTIADEGVLNAAWSAITEADTGQHIYLPGAFASLTVQTVGDFTTSGAITLQGSNDGTNWGTLKDIAGTSVVMTAATMLFQVRELPMYVRPAATAGTAVSMDVYITARRR